MHEPMAFHLDHPVRSAGVQRGFYRSVAHRLARARSEQKSQVAWRVAMEARFRLECLRTLELRLSREDRAAKLGSSPFAARLLDCCLHKPVRSHRQHPRLPQLQV